MSITGKLFAALLLFSALPVAAAEKALDFEAADGDRVYHVDAAALSLTTTGTIEFWMKPESWDSRNGYNNRIMSNDNGSTAGFNLLLRNYSGAHKLTFTPDRFTTTCTSGNIPDTWLGTWHHVAMSYSAGTVSWYFDGAASTTASCGVAIVDSGGNFAIGAYPAGSEEYDGILDDVRVWSDVRTSGEVADNYDCALVGTEAGLAASWRFNDDLTDDSSNSLDLTAVATPAYVSDIPAAVSGTCGEVVAPPAATSTATTTDMENLTYTVVAAGTAFFWLMAFLGVIVIMRFFI